MNYPYGWESVSNDISRAVESALNRNFTVQQFIQVARECWANELRDKARFADKDFEDALKGGIK